MKLRILAIVLCFPAFAQNPVAAPAGARLAFLMESGKVLIVGSELRVELENMPGLDPFPVQKELETGGLRTVTSNFYARQKAKYKMAGWVAGQTWRIYPGAGAPATVSVVDKGFIESWCQVDYDGATAKFSSQAAANRLGGLRAGIFLAAPGQGWASVSQEPLMPVLDPERERAAAAIMAQRGREFLLENAAIQHKEFDRLNQAFAGTADDAARTAAFRWKPAGGPPLLLVEALWYDSSTREPIFAATAIFEEVPKLNLRDFDGGYGLHMRLSDGYHVASMEDMHSFLNAWKVGSKTYILKRHRGYAGSAIELEELSASGLTTTTLRFAQGCD